MSYRQFTKVPGQVPQITAEYRKQHEQDRTHSETKLSGMFFFYFETIHKLNVTSYIGIKKVGEVSFSGHTTAATNSSPCPNSAGLRTER